MKIEKLTKLKKLTPINELTNEQVKELQNALKQLGYNVGIADGVPGSKTRSSWLQLMADTFGSNMILIGPDAAKLLNLKLNNSGDEGEGETGNSGALVLKLKLLPQIKKPVPIYGLNKNQLLELQTALSRIGYPVGIIDGLYGAKTRNAWAEFEVDVFGGNPLLINPVSVDILQNKLNKVGGGKVYDFVSAEGTIEAIKRECIGQEINLKTQIAYVLATVEWETARTFKPVREAFWLSEEWRKENLRYFPFYGRGFVQITWEKNYKKYSDILEVDLVGMPDLAMNEIVALFILVHGFKTGAFTGRKIADYVNKLETNFVDARRCINGIDHAEDIAKLAEKYLAAL